MFGGTIPVDAPGSSPGSGSGSMPGSPMPPSRLSFGGGRHPMGMQQAASDPSRNLLSAPNNQTQFGQFVRSVSPDMDVAHTQRAHVYTNARYRATLTCIYPHTEHTRSARIDVHTDIRIHVRLHSNCRHVPACPPAQPSIPHMSYACIHSHHNAHIHTCTFRHTRRGHNLLARSHCVCE